MEQSSPRSEAKWDLLHCSWLLYPFRSMQSVKALLCSFLFVFWDKMRFVTGFPPQQNAQSTRLSILLMSDDSQWGVAKGWPECFPQQEHTSLLRREFCMPCSGSCNFPLGTTHLGVTTSATISLGTGSWNGLYFIQSFAPHSSLSHHSRCFSVIHGYCHMDYNTN